MSFLSESKDNSDLIWALGLKIASLLHLSSVVKWREGEGSSEDKTCNTKKEDSSHVKHHHYIQGTMYIAVKVMFYPSLLCYRIAREVYYAVLHRILMVGFVQWTLTHLVWPFGSRFSVKDSSFSSFLKRLLDLLGIVVSFAFRLWGIVKELSIHDLRQLLLCVARGEPLTDELSSVFNDDGRRKSEHNYYYIDPKGVVSFDDQEHWMEGEYLYSNEMKSIKRRNRTSLLLSYAEAQRTAACEKEDVAYIRRKLIYDIPLKPFQATVERYYDSSSDASDNDDGAFSLSKPSHEIVTPISIPLSPNRRAMAMNHSSIMSDDVVYLARARLRLDECLNSEDTTTRVTADFLKRQSQLAVLNPRGTAGNIALSCGQHCATKIGPALYSSIRSMVPVLRNRYIFCQFSITALESCSANLSIGLSTSDMPENALVGAWKYSVGLDSTGQILLSSRWHRCEGTKEFGVGSTVGLLVFVDDSTVYQSWDGEKVTAYCMFSVDGEGVGVMVGPTEVDELRKAYLPLYCMDMDVTPAPGGTTEGSGAVGCIELDLPGNTDVYPTLTLQSPFTQVQCRFDSADLVLPRPPNGKTARESIGAPLGVAVYGLDGSVVLSASDI